ncbi:MAG: ThaI family type II restriction endonuclease [Candidatus Heimdallarchaeota archaeon]
MNKRDRLIAEKLFYDNELVSKIKNRLPVLFTLAEIESSRAGKIGMEVGSLRERIIVALLIAAFGKENVETNIPITKAEVDVKVYNKPLSIKTKTGKSLSGVKIAWTVDSSKAREFIENYQPLCDLIFVQIIWNEIGGFYYISTETQKELLETIGFKEYFKLPKQGTNPRGVEISKMALAELLKAKETEKIEIFWEKKKINYDPYKKWINYWLEPIFQI